MPLNVNQLKLRKVYLDILSGQRVRVTCRYGGGASGVFWSDVLGRFVPIDIKDGDLEELPGEMVVIGFRNNKDDNG